MELSHANYVNELSPAVAASVAAAIAAYAMVVAISVRFAWLATRATMAADAAAAVVPVATALYSLLLLVVMMVVVPLVVMLLPFVMATVMAVMAVVDVVFRHGEMVGVHVARFRTRVARGQGRWQAEQLRPIGVLHPPSRSGLQRRGQEVVGWGRQFPKAHHVAGLETAHLGCTADPSGCSAATTPVCQGNTWESSYDDRTKTKVTTGM